MPKLGVQSLEHLKTCDERLQKIFLEVVKHIDCTILEGHRNREQQNIAYKNRASKLKWPEGKHNTLPSLAVDVAPYPIDWANTRRFDHFAGFVKGVAQSLGIPIRWGGDWDQDHNPANQTFNDLLHYEIAL